MQFHQIFELLPILLEISLPTQTVSNGSKQENASGRD